MDLFGTSWKIGAAATLVTGACGHKFEIEVVPVKDIDDSKVVMSATATALIERAQIMMVPIETRKVVSDGREYGSRQQQP